MLFVLVVFYSAAGPKVNRSCVILLASSHEKTIWHHVKKNNRHQTDKQKCAKKKEAENIQSNTNWMKVVPSVCCLSRCSPVHFHLNY